MTQNFQVMGICCEDTRGNWGVQEIIFSYQGNKFHGGFECLLPHLSSSIGHRM